MARTNYSFEKRQRELAKKKKREEKRARKTGRGEAKPDATQPAGTDEAQPVPGEV